MKNQSRLAAAFCLAALIAASRHGRPGARHQAHAAAAHRHRQQHGSDPRHRRDRPGGSTGRHTHFGTETGYTLEGSASLEIEGETPKLLKAGESYVIGAGKVHDAKVVGDAPAKVLAVYVVEKGKPLATPAN
jgi:mannose-6-phosphate isomerase-like protein (cupin superfamily)